MKKTEEEKNAVIRSMPCHTMNGNKTEMGTWVQASLNQLLYMTHGTWHMAHPRTIYRTYIFISYISNSRISENIRKYVTIFCRYHSHFFFFFFRQKCPVQLRLPSISIFHSPKRSKWFTVILCPVVCQRLVLCACKNCSKSFSKSHTTVSRSKHLLTLWAHIHFLSTFYFYFFNSGGPLHVHCTLHTMKRFLEMRIFT